jgi:hypothetical protein
LKKHPLVTKKEIKVVKKRKLQIKVVKKRKKIKQQWVPFEKCAVMTNSEARQAILDTKCAVKNEEEMQNMIKDLQSCTTFKNNIYTVAVYPPDNFIEDGKGGEIGFIHLSIKRNDRAPVTNWNHLQRIKNELVGPEHEGVELFPAESRLVNMANQYHLWVLNQPGKQFPFGFNDGRNVSNQIEGSRAKQRLEETISEKGLRVNSKSI